MSNIPEDVKPWPLIGYAPGSYNNTCQCCKTQMTKVNKLCFMCLECAVKDTHKYIGILEGEITKYRQALEKIAANSPRMHSIATEALNNK